MTLTELRGIPNYEFEHDVLDLLESHGTREGTLLDSYRRVVDESPPGGAVEYLVRLILEDEERHHRVLTEMANYIRSLVWEVEVEPKAPGMAARSDPSLVVETKRLLGFEIEDAKQLRKLRKALRGSPKSWLHPLLVDLMLHDTAKHIAILKHIRKQLARG
jgi:hypothetical protein